MSDQQTTPEPGAGSTNTPAPPTFTQEQVNAILARERKSLETKLGGQSSEQVTKLQAELEQLRQEREDAGKSAAEKAAAQAARERAQYERQLADRDKALAERDNLVKQRELEIRDTRLDHELGSLMAGAKVLPQALRPAMLLFRSDATVEYGDDGKVLGVDMGEARYKSVAEAHAAWMKSHGAIFVAAPTGGAGSRAGNGLPAGKTLADLSSAELIALGNQQRAARR